MAKDQADWHNQARAIADYARGILNHAGAAFGEGVAYQGRNYVLFGCMGTMYVLAPERGISPSEDDRSRIPSALYEGCN
jgi:hypothetical protein